MHHDERRRITGLAERLRHAQPASKDPRVEDLIAKKIAPQPDVLYLLVETVLAQENALRIALARNPERSTTHPQALTSSGGFLARVFGRGTSRSGRGFLKWAVAAGGGLLFGGLTGGGLLLSGLAGAFSDDEVSAGDDGLGEPVGFTGEDRP